MKRVIMVLAAVLLVAGLSVPALAQDQEPITSSTTVTVSVLADINEQISLEYSPEYPGNPIYPGPPSGGHDPDHPWVMGTLIPQSGAYGAPAGANTMVEGYLWAYRYQSNEFTRCVVSHEAVSGFPSLGDVLHPFLWYQKWAGAGWGERVHPSAEHWVSDSIDPSYGSTWDIPNMVEFNMGQPGDGHEGISPWSIPAGDYMSKVITDWWIHQEEPYPDEPLLSREGYLKVVVAPVFNGTLKFAIGGPNNTPGNPPLENTYETLEVGDDWQGVVHPYILDFQSNAPSWNKVTVKPIRFDGQAGGADIRRYMTHYAWTSSAFDDGHPMYPGEGQDYTFEGQATASLTSVWDIPNKVAIDLSGDTDTNGVTDCWQVQAGTYKPADNIGMTLEFGFGDATVHTIQVSKDNLQVQVPQRQENYQLPAEGSFTPYQVTPEETATYTYTLECHQNHNRVVSFTASGLGNGSLTWNFEELANVIELEAAQSEAWRGLFQFNTDGAASQLRYTFTYTPDWTAVPGPKTLTITMSHSPQT